MNISLDKIAPPVAFVIIGFLLLALGAIGVIPIGDPQPIISEPILKVIFVVLGIILILLGPWFVWRERVTQQNNDLKSALHTSAVDSSGASASIRMVTTNDLGKGIRIGGFLNTVAMKLMVGDWQRYADKGWVVSGWLYPSQDSSSLAAVFFKFHLIDNGRGYVHILDAANPPNSVWIATSTGVRKEGDFCWDGTPGIERTAFWEFTWDWSKEKGS